jgi:hypothetical protein
MRLDVLFPDKKDTNLISAFTCDSAKLSSFAIEEGA